MQGLSNINYLKTNFPDIWDNIKYTKYTKLRKYKKEK
jgi:hypothetical protein